MKWGVLAALWMANLLVFNLAPGIDLAFSGLFHDPDSGRFTGNQHAVLGLIRHGLWNAAKLCAITALVFGAHAAVTKRPTALPRRVWAFALLLIVLGPIGLVNGLLKGFWGRARPMEIQQFGGTAEFTLPWVITDQCEWNCSFASGEASAVACLAVIVGLFLWRDVRRRGLLVALLSALVMVGGLLRVMSGRHFLSDVTWSLVLIATLAALLAQWLRLAEVQDRITLRALAADARSLVAGLLSRLGPTRS